MNSVREEIKQSEERLRAEMFVSRAEAKADHLHLAGKVDTIAKDHTRRLETLEEKTETPNPHTQYDERLNTRSSDTGRSHDMERVYQRKESKQNAEAMRCKTIHMRRYTSLNSWHISHPPKTDEHTRQVNTRERIQTLW